MPPESPHFATRALLHAKLDALLDECDLVADTAGYGQTLDLMEAFFPIKVESSSKKPSSRNSKSVSSVPSHCTTQLFAIGRFGTVY